MHMHMHMCMHMHMHMHMDMCMSCHVGRSSVVICQLVFIALTTP